MVFFVFLFGSLLTIEPVTYILCLLQGDEIHVVCKQDQLKSWKANLMKNCTYVMHNFKVMKNDGQFRVCDHQYKLAFTGVTVVRQSDLEDLPFKRYKFVEFTNVIVGHFQPKLLVGKFSCNLFNRFAHKIYTSFNDMSLFYDFLRHYWHRG